MVTLSLTVNHSIHDSYIVSACDRYSWHGTEYVTSGTYSYGYTNSEGCPSADTLHLTIHNGDTVTDSITTCDSLLWHGLMYYGDTNTPSFTTTNQSGCDSTVTLNLTVNNSTHDSYTVSACDSYSWHGTEYTISGTYTYSYTNDDGCPSSDTLHLTINYGDTVTDSITACDSLIWHGVVHFVDGNVWFDTLNTHGCDSSVLLTLTVTHGLHMVNSVTAVDSMVWQDSTYRVSGSYLYGYTNDDGCASTDTLHLTIVHASHACFADTACVSYSWHDSVYFNSGIYTYRYMNAYGVPSCDTLRLTIWQGGDTVVAVQACDSFYWWVRDTVFASSTTDTLRLAAANGCDSLVVLQLAVYQSVFAECVVHACDSFRWDANGSLYYSDTSDTLRLMGGHGCDSVIVLQLVLDSSKATLKDTAVCGALWWEVNDSLYSQSTLDTIRLTTAADCDSSVVLRLTVNRIDSTFLFDTLCDGSSLIWHGMICRQPGNYRYDTLNSSGCDSSVWLQLVVMEPPSVNIEEDYDCLNGSYHLTAVTTAPYVEWHADPADNAGLVSSQYAAEVSPSARTTYWVRADWREELFCPAYDTVVLLPFRLPTASVAVYPEFLTESNLTLRAQAQCYDAQRMQWWVDGRWYADNRATIVYTASPLADSVCLTVLAANELCADTVSVSVPLYHEELFVPNIFVPEGAESEHRLFCVKSEAVIDFEMTIYTRGGVAVFHAEDIGSCWDGTYNGEPCLQGTYLYNIRYRIPSVPNNWKNRTGTVTLVR